MSNGKLEHISEVIYQMALGGNLKAADLWLENFETEPKIDFSGCQSLEDLLRQFDSHSDGA